MKKEKQEKKQDKKILYNFQQAALDKIRNFDNALLAAEMGTGKTLMSIEQSERWNSPALVCLVLKSTVQQWLDELESQTDRRVFNGYKRTKSDGIDAFIACSERKCIVIGYDAYKARCAKKLREYINANSNDVTMICDESSLIGNMKSQRTKSVLKSNTAHKIMLSGTPATGGKMENLIPTMHLLGWSITKDEFLHDYCDVYEWTNPARPWVVIPIIQGYKNIDQLHKELEKHGTVFLTMEEAGVELPEVTEQNIRQKRTADYKKFMKNGIITIGDEEIIGDNSLTKMMRARQLCSIYNPERAAAVEELLLQAGTEPVVVFYNWTAELDILKSICERLKRPVSVVNGQGRDLSAYYAGTPGTVVCVQYRAGSMGLNLQSSRICIFFSLPLSFSDFTQAKARVHRIGQNRNCVFYTIVCEDSVEEDILYTLTERKDYSEQLFARTYGELGGVAA